jgi:hypothetical protein
MTAAWQLRSCPEATALGLADMSDPSKFSAEFTADVRGAYTLQLSFPECSQASGGKVDVVLSDPPLAVAGPDWEVGTLEQLRFGGWASQDPDRHKLSWSCGLLVAPPGSARTSRDLMGPAGPLVALQPGQPGQFCLELRVSDGVFEARGTVDLLVSEGEGCGCASGQSQAPSLLLGVGLRRRRKKT